MSGPRLDGWWSVQSTEGLRPEHMDQVRDLLQSARERDEQVVVVEGLTFTWHEVPKVTEDDIRHAALTEAIAAVRRLYADSDDDEGEAWDGAMLCLSEAAVIEALTRLREGS